MRFSVIPVVRRSPDRALFTPVGLQIFSSCHTTHLCGITSFVQESLTPPQQKLLTYIFDSIRNSGRPPTVREICRQFNYRSTGTARDHLHALETKGHLKKLPGKSRGLVPSNWSKLLRAE